MAKIDVSKIPGYSEMSADDKLKALEGYEYDDGSAEIERQKNAVSKANSEAAEWRRKHNALLSDDDKAKQEAAERLASMEKELDTLRKEKLVSEYKSKYLALGYDEALASDTSTALAENDYTKVFANQQKFLESHDKTLKADLLKGTPTPPAGGEGTQMTREDIMKIRDSAERQAAIATNMSLFKKG